MAATKHKVSFVVVGGGQRGFAYTAYTQAHPDEGEVLAICEPRDDRRQHFAKTYGVPPERCYRDWRELAALPKMADAVYICTIEDLHRDSAVAFADKGYHILLEKPMAPTPGECRDIVAAVKRNGVILSVCHVLRYVEHIRRVKQMLESGLIGRVRHIAATEFVGPMHFSHAFVRGNFRNQTQSSFFLLAKCCHDMDLLAWLVASRCVRASSFGRLSYFKKENQSAGAASRCTKCPPRIESTCPYSALKIYLRDRVGRYDRWPVRELTLDATAAGVERALDEGPYGRCVYECDNDVVDHQVVNLEFEDGTTVGFIATGFAEGSRDYFIMGDKGSLRMNEDGVHHHDFLSGKTVTTPLLVGNISTQSSGHGGGDFGVVRDFLAAVRANDPSLVSTGADVSLASHLIVFAAEQARHSGTVESVPRG